MGAEGRETRISRGEAGNDEEKEETGGQEWRKVVNNCEENGQVANEKRRK